MIWKRNFLVRKYGPHFLRQMKFAGIQPFCFLGRETFEKILFQFSVEGKARNLVQVHK